MTNLNITDLFLFCNCKYKCNIKIHNLYYRKEKLKNIYKNHPNILIYTQIINLNRQMNAINSMLQNVKYTSSLKYEITDE